MAKTYKVTATFRVVVGEDERVKQEPEAVAKAVRDYLMANTTTTTTAGGYAFVRPFIVMAEEEG